MFLFGESRHNSPGLWSQTDFLTLCAGVISYFGTNRTGSNLVPDDCSAFFSAYLDDFLPSDAEEVLYAAEIDHGQAFRCCSALTLPLEFLFKVPSAVFSGLVSTLLHCSFDQPWCWVRKEYSTRTFFRVYGNRIEINQPQLRVPFGFLGCGSWNSDQSVNHAFDRGAFGFSVVRGYSSEHSCLVFPVFGGVVARHRCQCNGPVWNRMFTDCGKNTVRSLRYFTFLSLIIDSRNDLVSHRWLVVGLCR